MGAYLRHLRQSQHGAFVNMSSIAATAGPIKRSCFSASKGAVLSLTLAMAAELLPDGIRVNCVARGDNRHSLGRPASVQGFRAL
jgi:2-keto-3-deoxy-L-fuconate dehydrogenase